MKDILLLGALYSQDKIAEYKVNSKGGLQFAAQNLQESIIEGAMANDASVTVLSRPVLSTYPHGYRKRHVDDCDFVFRGVKLGHSLGYCNLPFLNHPSLSKYLSYIDEWYESHNRKKVIWVYSLTPQLMEVAIEAKKKYHDIEIVQIVPDLIRFCGCNKYYKLLGLQERKIKKVARLCKSIDKFVLLCENMAEDLGIQDKPYIVMEGIFSPEKDEEIVEKDSHKTILYTGNLDARYGIIDLLNAFDLIKDEDYRLWIRGNGATEPIIRERMSKDSRISLIPQLSKVELLRLEKKATLLVNPVSPSQEFTNYFFPSKTMDYLASGTPTIMYPLTCLPSEYKEHLYFFTGNTVEQMEKDMERVCNYDKETLSQKGDAAKQFIYSSKLSKQQVKKILNL